MPAPPVRFKKRPRKKEQVVPVEEEEEEGEVDEDALVVAVSLLDVQTVLCSFH